MSSAFAQLPAAVLSDILWLTPFVDTLRCEQVCRSWRQVSKRSAAVSKDSYPAWSPGIWGEELALLIFKHGKDWEDPALKLEQSDNSRNIAITLLLSTGDSTHFHEVFFMWLTEHAAGFIKVSVYKADPQSSWLFARTVLAIGTASLSAPPIFTVHFDAGELYFDCMTHRLCVTSYRSLTAAGMFTSFALTCCYSFGLKTACVFCRFWGDTVVQLL